MMTNERRTQLEGILIERLQQHAHEIGEIYQDMQGYYNSGELIYRFYHQSFKVFYHASPLTEHAVRLLKSLMTEFSTELWADWGETPTESIPYTLHPWFEQLITEGTGRAFDHEFNKDWLKYAQPVIEAFLHAKFFIDVAHKIIQNVELTQRFDTDWAAFLYLYNLR